MQHEEHVQYVYYFWEGSTVLGYCPFFFLGRHQAITLRFQMKGAPLDRLDVSNIFLLLEDHKRSARSSPKPGFLARQNLR